MKKLIKFILVAVVIGVVAFIIIKNTSGDNKSVAYAKVYEFNNSVVVNDVQIVPVVNNTVQKISEIMVTDNYAEDEKLNDFKVFLNEINYYTVINNQILNNSVLIKSGKYNYNKEIESSYEKLYNRYVNCYNYLNRYILGIINTNYDKEVLKSYVIQFYNTFNGMQLEYNNFYYYLGLEYGNSEINTIQNNRLFKLKINHYVNLINLYVTNVESGVTADDVTAYASKVTNSTSVYYENAEAVKDIYYNISKIDQAEIVKQIKANTLNTYIESLKTQEEKTRVQKYSDLVLEVQ